MSLLLFYTHNANPSLTAETGTFSLTGNAAGLVRNIPLTAAAGSFVLTGQSTTSRRGYALDAEPFASSISGAGGLLLALGSPSSTGTSFVLTGQDAGSQHVRRLLAGAGSFAFTGKDAELRELVLFAETGVFVLTSVEIELVRRRKRMFTTVVSGGGMRASSLANIGVRATTNWG